MEGLGRNDNTKDIEDVNVDIEIEEHLTELLDDIYEKWKECHGGHSGRVCSEKERVDAFCTAIEGKLKRGFSIICRPGMYDEEEILRNLLGKLYIKWKNYVQDAFKPNVDIFIRMAKSEMDTDIDKDSYSWKVLR